MLDEQADQVTIRCVRPFTGRKPGQEWVASGPFAASWIASGHAVRADVWAARRQAALAAKHLGLDAADHDGEMAGEALLKVIIRDPKVQACGEWLYLERPAFRKVFTEGLFPGGLQEGIWPVVLDVEKLIRIFGGEVSQGRSWGTIITQLDTSGPVDQAVDPAGPVYHAAKAIADQHKAFFDLFRFRHLVGEGTYKKTGERRLIDELQFSRLDKRMDCATSDLIEKKEDDFGTGKVLWEGLVLRMPANKPAAAVETKKAVTERTPSTNPSKRGPKLRVGKRVKDEMVHQLDQKLISRETLANMGEKVMAGRYGASRDTCRKARLLVLSEFPPDK
jgi:hypothetical protein